MMPWTFLPHMSVIVARENPVHVHKDHGNGRTYAGPPLLMGPISVAWDFCIISTPLSWNCYLGSFLAFCYKGALKCSSPCLAGPAEICSSTAVGEDSTFPFHLLQQPHCPILDLYPPLINIQTCGSHLTLRLFLDTFSSCPEENFLQMFNIVEHILHFLFNGAEPVGVENILTLRLPPLSQQC